MLETAKEPPAMDPGNVDAYTQEEELRRDNAELKKPWVVKHWPSEYAGARGYAVYGWMKWNS